MGPRAGLDECGKSRPPNGIRSPDRPARSKSLNRVSYPGQLLSTVAVADVPANAGFLCVKVAFLRDTIKETPYSIIYRLVLTSSNTTFTIQEFHVLPTQGIDVVCGISEQTATISLCSKKKNAHFSN